MAADGLAAAEPRLDITLVSGRRPELLRRTLASFREGLFATFPVAGVYANIDPIFGDAADHAACRAAILATFPDAVISEPATAGFGKAVRTLWAATRSAFVFHLEDDWVLNEPLRPEQVFPLLSGDTKALAPVSKELGWDGRSTFNVRRHKIRFLGIPVGHRTVNIFGTSPRFLAGDFARACAALMDPDLDPEKQMRPPSNPALRAYMQSFRCRFLPARTHPELISDIGRSWRDERGIDKVVAGGVSTWTPRA
jgi:hypothetical protein